MGINPIDWFAKSKVGQKLYKWAASPKGQKFTATTLPCLETIASTTFYVISTEKQNKLDRREKNILQWQNVISGVLGASLGLYINKKVFNFGENVIKNLDPKKVPDAHKVMGAVRVGLPIIGTGILMRYVLPVATAYVSGILEENKSKKNKKLDVMA